MSTASKSKVATVWGSVISRYVGAKIHVRLPAEGAPVHYDYMEVVMHDDESLVDSEHNKERIARARTVVEAFDKAAFIGMGEAELCHFMSKVVG